MTVEVGDQIIAMRKDGHWCQATVQSIGTFDVVTILWEDGMTGDVKKSQGLLRPMGKILGHTCPRGVTYGGVKVPGDLREVPLSREHQKLQELAHLIKEESAKCNIRPEVVAATIQRESNAGLTLSKKGWGDRGNAYGIMQVDEVSHSCD